MLNFFQDKFKMSSSCSIFGLCDNRDQKPAFIDETDRGKWDAIVNNNSQKLLDFYPLDNAIELRDAKNNQLKLCDGLLCNDKKTHLIFVELKSGKYKNHKEWCTDGKAQLESTILNFVENYDISNRKIDAYISNRNARRELLHTTLKEDFNRKTGLILKINREIDIS